MEDIWAIDVMNRIPYAGAFTEEEMKESFRTREFKAMVKGTFGGWAKRYPPGEEWKVLGLTYRSSLEEVLAEMEEVKVEKVLMDPLMMWSWWEHKFITNFPIERIIDVMDRAKGKVIGGVSYNPLRIEESLREVEKAVKEYGFKYVWFHPISFGLAPNDRKCYPLYGKCSELGIPCCFQVGHSAEPLPSELGHPMYADDVAIDFPELTIVLTHTGWPWVSEWMSMLWRHPNVYGNIGGYMPASLGKELVDFMDGGQGRKKVMWATNGLGLTRCKKEFMELPIKDETKRRVLRENAIEVFKLS